MNEETKKGSDFFFKVGRTVLDFLIIAVAFTLCYRAGEVRVFDDNSVCKAIYTLWQADAKPTAPREVPFGGEK